MLVSGRVLLCLSATKVARIVPQKTHHRQKDLRISRRHWGSDEQSEAYSTILEVFKFVINKSGENAEHF